MTSRERLRQRTRWTCGDVGRQQWERTERDNLKRDLLSAQSEFFLSQIQLSLTSCLYRPLLGTLWLSQWRGRLAVIYDYQASHWQ